MKKMKKLLSLAAAAVLTAAPAGSMCANAMVGFGNRDGFEGYTECDENMFSTANNPYDQHFRYYYKADGKNFKIIQAHNAYSPLVFTVSADIDLEDVQDTIREVRPDFIFHKVKDTSGDYIVTVQGDNKVCPSDETYNEKNITSAQAAEICGALKEKGYIKSFEYRDYKAAWMTGDFSLPGGFFVEEGDKERLEAYFEENGLDFTVKEYPDGSMTLDTDMTGDEAFEAMEQIAVDTGVKPRVIYLASESANSDKIDMFDYVDGDANEDGELDIADAVYIMQTITAPDKYSLTAQGRFNADISGDGDGITLGDALAVQEMLLGSR